MSALDTSEMPDEDIKKVIAIMIKDGGFEKFLQIGGHEKYRRCLKYMLTLEEDFKKRGIKKAQQTGTIIRVISRYIIKHNITSDEFIKNNPELLI